MHGQRSVGLGEAFSQAFQAYHDGRAVEARQLARQIVEARPDFGGAHYLLGLLALDAGQAKKAADHLAQAVTLDPGEVAPRLAMGRAQEMLGKSNTAILHYRAVLERAPDHAEAHFRMAGLLRRAGKAAEAVEHCRGAVAANPRHDEALNLLGALLHAAGEEVEAEAALRRALELRPDWPAALNNYGAVLRALGRPAEAATMLRAAAGLRGGHAPTLANLAGALREAGQLDEARAEAEGATRTDGRCPEAWLELGLVRLRQDHAEGAAAAFERAVAVSSRSPQAHWCLAEARRALGETVKAERHYRKCLELDPADRFGAALGLALCGAGPVPDKAPEAYVRQLFDDYAATFDAKLVDQLDYRAPQLLAAVLAAELTGRTGLAVMDAGCGTGLMAPVLRPMAAVLHGCDLSPAMVDKARTRGLYDDVQATELVLALAARPATYDLVVAADVLVYLGDLDPVLLAARSALKAGGAFAFTVERFDQGERADQGTYVLGAKSRYAHSSAYVRARAEAAGFAVARLDEASTRREAGAEVPGLVVVLKRLSLGVRSGPQGAASRRMPLCAPG